MALPLQDIIGGITDNIEKRGSLFPISQDAAHGWAQGLDISQGGQTIIYTGLLYQLVPYINASVKYLAQLEKTGKIGAGAAKFARAVGKSMDIYKLSFKASAKDIEAQHKIIRDIAKLLMDAGVNFGYLYEDEVYSGALLHDLGKEDLFQRHIKRVNDIFKKYGVKRVITIDPHTTNTLREVYPECLNDFGVEVRNYLKVLAEVQCRVKKVLREDVVIHDPCLYARYEKLIDQPRSLLKAGGLNIIEPEKTRGLTTCCGGPIESLSPRIAEKIAQIRINQLKEKGNNIVAMCPICFSNLNRVADDEVSIKDISHYLIREFGEGG